MDGKKVECKIAIPKEKKQKASKKKRKNPNQRGRGYSGTSNSSDEEKKASIRDRKVFIGGLPHTITEADLKKFFSDYGELEDYVVMVDRMTGKPRGFGFVTFAQVESVDKVMAQ